MKCETLTGSKLSVSSEAYIELKYDNTAINYSRLANESNFNNPAHNQLPASKSSVEREREVKHTLAHV